MIDGPVKAVPTMAVPVDDERVKVGDASLTVNVKPTLDELVVFVAVIM
jgi:hypothetical protein